MPPVYFDCNATTPIEPRVFEVMKHFLLEEYGNASSRTHEMGQRAKKAVNKAREQIAQVVNATSDEVIFTSGATESNNLAILGVRERANISKTKGKPHVITCALEHKAVLEPVQALADAGFEVTFIGSDSSGKVDLDALSSALKPTTCLVSLMHVNNETGVVQPIDRVCELLQDHDALLHVDAAQGFGKEHQFLKSKRIDMISVSGHKIFGPKGIGAFVYRHRGFERTQLTPIMYGGGQEKGYRPGTLPVHLIAGFGLAAELSLKETTARTTRCKEIRSRLFTCLNGLPISWNGVEKDVLPHVANFSIKGLDSEAAILSLKDFVHISNGSACTSSSYTLSHVLQAMKIPEDKIKCSIRMSWSHLTEDPDYSSIRQAILAIF